MRAPDQEQRTAELTRHCRTMDSIRKELVDGQFSFLLSSLHPSLPFLSLPSSFYRIPLITFRLLPRTSSSHTLLPLLILVYFQQFNKAIRNYTSILASVNEAKRKEEALQANTSRAVLPLLRPVSSSLPHFFPLISLTILPTPPSLPYFCPSLPSIIFHFLHPLILHRPISCEVRVQRCPSCMRRR